ncbi:MAG: YjbQ family protein [Candidatus Lokiarchaeota archaeon]|nr:YjbQ family protein [Candidatus Lokiarchaeota archaeon]MBD3199871.1 YjbQ family protein [Candidatus Lokiarchaeota archaeon]
MILKTETIKTPEREILLDITEDINDAIKSTNIIEGVCHVFIPHTTAGIIINENADPDVKKDIITHLKKLIPIDNNFSHMEGNSDAHIKSTLTGQSITVLIHKGNLVLGTWQGIMFAEYDGPRSRKIHIQIQGE